MVMRWAASSFNGASLSRVTKEGHGPGIAARRRGRLQWSVTLTSDEGGRHASSRASAGTCFNGASLSRVTKVSQADRIATKADRASMERHSHE